MKKRMNIVVLMVVWAVLAAFLVGCAGSYGTWDEQWYSDNPTTKESVIARLGAPDKVIFHDDGMQELIYIRKFPPSDAKSAMVYQIQNDQVVKQCWKEM